ncbi:hypothetical protein APTSU1_001712000 [Apodemus speciosus]|uniref:Uncharacterized protein n=1 Tax=Apodemus speciosus TaxID=105296 RepID=A0ABQ0FRL3_APOSI
MKMEEAVGKVEELIESAAPPKASEQETAKEEDGSVELESQVPKDGVADSTVSLFNALFVDGTEKGLFRVSVSIHRE